MSGIMSEKQPQLADWEVAIIRAMLASERFKKQEIVAYFSRPDRSINQVRISEIENDHERYRGIVAASAEQLEKVLEDWKTISFPSAPLVPPNPTSLSVLTARFELRSGEPPRLSVSETDTVEGKESFNWGNRHDYCKTLAGMANNKGGYILFGVKDGSFEIVGISDDRMDRFDLKKANEYITRTFNQALVLEKGQFSVAGKTIGVLHASASSGKPVVCKLDGGTLFSAYRVIAPDLPGFGQTKASPRGEFTYSFDSLAEVIGGFVDAIGAQPLRALHLRLWRADGLRLAMKHPERVTAIISQNGNAYVDGFSDQWGPWQAYWRDPSDANREACRPIREAVSRIAKHLKEGEGSCRLNRRIHRAHQPTHDSFTKWSGHKATAKLHKEAV